jgi:hypothetical protein
MLYRRSNQIIFSLNIYIYKNLSYFYEIKWWLRHNKKALAEHVNCCNHRIANKHGLNIDS